MLEEEKKELEEDKGVDPLSQFMFGKGRNFHAKKADFNEEHQPANIDQDYDWLFGKRRSAPVEKVEPESQGIHHTIGRFMQNIDYIETMKHIDTLMSSANELKPLLKKVKPLIESFTQKK